MKLSMLNKARELKAKMEEVQKELAETVIETNFKGNIKLVIDGQQKIQSIKISPKVINPEKPEALEEMVLKAVNEAINKSQKMAAKQLGKLTGGLKIPGLF